MSTKPDIDKHNAKPSHESFAFGAVELADGVRRWNARTYIYSAFWTIAFLTFLSAIQNYVLRVHLALPEADIGRAVGNLSFVGELVFLCVSPFLGALSDKVGRRVIFALGFVWIGAGFTLYPLARSYEMLLLIRAMTGIGAAALGGMMAVILSDYPTENRRGRMAAFSGLFNGLGAFSGIFFLSKLPAIFASLGLSEQDAGSVTFFTVAILAIVTGVIIYLGLKPGKPGKSQSSTPLPQLMRQGLSAAKTNPRLRLAFVESFITRGDILLIGTFLSAWMFGAAIDMHGLTPPEASSQMGRYGGITHLSALLWAPVFGLMLDRFDRVTNVAIAMGLASVGYISVGLTDDIVSPAAILPLILLGIGEFSVIMAGQTLVAQESPLDIRGSVLGVFGFFGALGLLIVSKIGGEIASHFDFGRVFILIGVINILILIYAVYIRIRTGYKPPRQMISEL